MFKRMVTLLTVMAIVFSLGQIAISAETSEIIIEAESYISSGTSKLSVSSSVPSVTNSAWTPALAEKNTVVPVNDGNWIAYNVTVPESGAYTIKANVGVPTGVVTRLTVLDNAEGLGALCETTLAETGGWTTYVLQEVGNVYLNAGENYLRFINNVGSMYINSFVLTRNSAEDDITYKQTINAEFYSDSYSHRATTGVNKVPVARTGNDYYLSYNSGEWAEYEVYVNSDGFYNAGITAGIGDATSTTVKYSISCNGVTADASFKGSGSFTAYKEYVIGMVKLYKGLNKIRITNTNASSFFQNIFIEKADVTTEIDLTSYAEKSENTTVADGTVTLGADGYITYNVDFIATGAYELAIDADVTVTLNNVVYEKGEKFSINAGTHALKISTAEEVSFDAACVSLFSIGRKYEAESFIASYDKSAGGVFSATATLSFNPGDWLAYNIDADKAGQYELIVYGQTYKNKIKVLKGLDDDNYVLAAGNSKVFSAWTHAYSTICKFNLDEGENTIRLYDEVEGFVFDNFYLSYVGEPVLKTEMKFEAEGFASSFDYINDSTSQSFSKTNSSLSFNEKDWVAFNVYADKAGAYTVKTHGVAIDNNTVLKVLYGLEDNNYVLGSGSPVDSGEDWSNFEYALSTITNINLKEGKNVIRIYNARGSYFFDYFTLTYAGEAEYIKTYEGLVENAKERYDSSADTTIPISADGTTKYISFGTNDYVDFDFYAEVPGVYEVVAYHALPGSDAPALSVVNNNASACSGKLPTTTGFYDFTPTSVGEIILSEGKNEVRIISTAAQFHFEKCVLNYVGQVPAISLTIEAEEYDLGGEGVGYHDNTYDVDDGDYIWYGDDVERVLTDDGFAIDMQAEEWLCYTIEVPKAGYYNIDALADGMTDAKTAAISVNDANKLTFDINTLYNGKYLWINVGDIYLNKGSNTIKFELASGTNLVIDKLALYTDDIEVAENANSVTATGNLNGLFGDKEVLCTLAVYEDNRLYSVDTVTTISGLAESIDLAVEGIEKQDGKVYSAKVFVWNNMQGNVIVAE